MNRQVKSIARQYGLQIVILVLVVGVLASVAPNFTGESAIYATLERLLILGIVTAGLAVTMIAAELDLSAAGMAVLSGVIAVQLSGMGLVASVAIACLVGGLLGLLQGWLIARIGINSLVFTVGTMIVLQGVAWLVAGGRPISVQDYMVTDPLLARYWVFSPLSIIAIIFMVLLGMFLTWTKWGREIYAVGGSRQEAVAAGVSVKRTMVLAFGISGFAGALAGSLSAMKGGSVTPDSFSTILLTCVAAALVGGVSLHGGRGTIWSIVLGVLIIAILSAGLSSMGVASYVTELMTGTLLLTVILLDFVLKKVTERRRISALRSARV